MIYTTKHAVWAMSITVILSNLGVCFPINDFLTYGAFTYPFTFLVTELTNRLHGPAKARKVVYVGFFLGAALSILVAPWRIAFASGTAFLCSQLLDIALFSQIRRGPWWYAPLFASCVASLFDSLLFWRLAFPGDDLPLLSWALGDTCVKWAMDLFFLLPFRMLSLSALTTRSR